LGFSHEGHDGLREDTYCLDSRNEENIHVVGVFEDLLELALDLPEDLSMSYSFDSQALGDLSH
jgi:hypothetical protein